MNARLNSPSQQGEKYSVSLYLCIYSVFRKYLGFKLLSHTCDYCQFACMLQAFSCKCMLVKVSQQHFFDEFIIFGDCLLMSDHTMSMVFGMPPVAVCWCVEHIPEGQGR